MNNYNNNIPNLSASDRIKDIKAQAIFKGTQKNYRANNCSSRNIKFYKNGTIKNVKSYDIKAALARGHVFCGDCNQKGINCSSFRKAKINMGNNITSEYWGGGAVIGSQGRQEQSAGFTVISSNTSGEPWENIENNVISIPKNLDGNDIFIDPNNNLFGNGPCYNFKNMDYAIQKTYVILRSAIPIIKQNSGLFENINTIPGSCDDERNEYVRNSIFTMTGLNGEPDIFTGRITNLCCLRQQKLKDPDPVSTVVLNDIGIFDVYIELFNINNKDLLNRIANYTSLFSENRYFWGDLQDTFAGINLSSKSQVGGFWYPSIIESIRIIQGTPEKGSNQTKYNNTKQNYMSCLEDGTKTINLALPHATIKPIVKSYCNNYSDYSIIFTPTYPTTIPFNYGKLPYSPSVMDPYPFGNCGSVVGPTYPYIVMQFDNNQLSGQGWAICGGVLSYPENIYVYDKVGVLLAGGSMGGINSLVVNQNPVQILIYLTMISDPSSVIGGYIVYKNGDNIEDPFIESSTRLYIADSL